MLCFWILTPCRLTYTSVSEKHAVSIFRAEVMCVENVDIYQRVYTISKPRWRMSLSSPPWEPEIPHHNASVCSRFSILFGCCVRLFLVITVLQHIQRSETSRWAFRMNLCVLQHWNLRVSTHCLWNLYWRCNVGAMCRFYSSRSTKQIASLPLLLAWVLELINKNVERSSQAFPSAFVGVLRNSFMIIFYCRFKYAVLKLINIVSVTVNCN